VLASTLRVPRDSLSRSLVALEEFRLVERNPGYGHPLRPEYLLTARGTRVAAACSRYLDPLADDQDLMTRKWTAPVLVCCLAGLRRFNAIRAALDITPRALTQAMKQLESSHLIVREVSDGYPPLALYSLSATGHAHAQTARAILNALAPRP